MTTRIVHESQVIVAESLNGKGMTCSAQGTRTCPGTNVKGKARLNRSLLDASMAELIRQLGYRSKCYGRTFVQAARDFPSSGLCSMCGDLNTELTVGETGWTCATCGTHHVRDENAGVNLKAEGLRMLEHPEDTGGVRGWCGGEGRGSNAADVRGRVSAHRRVGGSGVRNTVTDDTAEFRRTIRSSTDNRRLRRGWGSLEASADLARERVGSHDAGHAPPGRFVHPAPRRDPTIAPTTMPTISASPVVGPISMGLCSGFVLTG